MAAYSAVLRGASNIFVVDRVPERLSAATKMGCTAIDFTASDPVEAIVKKNGGMVDRAVDCVGYQAVDSSGSTEKPNIVLDQLIRVTRATGGLGVPGLYVPADPGAADEKSKEGQILIPFGKLFEKVLYSTPERFSFFSPFPGGRRSGTRFFTTLLTLHASNRA